MPDSDNTTPCRHEVRQQEIDATKNFLLGLEDTNPALIQSLGIPPGAWPNALRAAVESLRGSWAASTSFKYSFIEAILENGVTAGVFSEWESVGSVGRNDFKILMPNGNLISLEAKGCPDGNNTTIWDRPTWADEFVVWSLCPHGMAHNPGRGVWSGIATRLIPKSIAEGVMVDAFIFFDPACGSALRPCPKAHGLIADGDLRSDDFLSGHSSSVFPPPCIYLFPDSLADPETNPHPPVQTWSSLSFISGLLALFNVPVTQRSAYVHDARVAIREKDGARQLKITVTSRNWADQETRDVESSWKTLRRE